jgi:hypothetical protein
MENLIALRIAQRQLVESKYHQALFSQLRYYHSF